MLKTNTNTKVDFIKHWSLFKILWSVYIKLFSVVLLKNFSLLHLRSVLSQSREGVLPKSRISQLSASNQYTIMQSLHGLTLNQRGAFGSIFYLLKHLPILNQYSPQKEDLTSAALPLRDPSTKALIFLKDTVRSATTAVLWAPWRI